MMTKTAIRRTIEAAAFCLAPLAAKAGSCERLIFDSQPFTVCTATAREDVRLFLTGADGRPVGTFERLAAEAGDQRVVFAMNAGMYHPDRRPVGLYADESGELTPLVTRAGPGNFGMVPNGVFCIAGGAFKVTETLRFAEIGPACRFATQSGPLLVWNGTLHPRFIEGSDALNIRNGVGVSTDGQTAWFAISDAPVNFHTFARLFRDGLNAPNALYFDGKISRLFAPELGREDTGFPMGPIVALLAPRD